LRIEPYLGPAKLQYWGKLSLSKGYDISPKDITILGNDDECVA
jgi:hypothetical protein